MATAAKRTIVLTRPAGRNDALARAVRAAVAGKEVLDLVPLPLLRVDPVSADERAIAADAVTAMSPRDWLIFVSPRAATFAEDLRPVSTWPAGRVLAVGQATADTLRGLGVSHVDLPRGSQDSEGLLAALSDEGHGLSGRRIWIVRGNHGREKLGRELRVAGAEVCFLAVYRRGCAVRSDDAAVIGRLAGSQSIWIVTAPEGLQCLLDAVRGAGRAAEVQGLLNSRLVVINQRTQALARQLGFAGPIACAGAPDDQALAAAVRGLMD